MTSGEEAELGTFSTLSIGIGGMVGGGGLARDTVTRFLGLIVVAMGVQFALSGIRSFFGASGAS